MAALQTEFVEEENAVFYSQFLQDTAMRLIGIVTASAEETAPAASSIAIGNKAVGFST